MPHHDRSATTTNGNSVNLSYKCNTIKELIKQESKGDKNNGKLSTRSNKGNNK
jgi:hypothetical protein